ncbi:MAG: hypothetical protein ACOZNI_29180 [Myxococcota bacterium]
MSVLALTARVLRDPAGLVAEHDTADGLARVAPSLLVVAASGAAVFGAAVGSYRGGVQTLYAALKMPVLLVLPPLLVLPALAAAWRACDVETSRRRLALAALAGMARTGVLAAAMAPALWLPYSVRVDYHLAVVLMAGALAFVGLPGLVTIARTAVGGQHRFLATAGCLFLLGLVTAQTGWLLRPFVARPRADVALFRPIESDVISSISATASAATGDYREWEPEEAGFLGRRSE